MRDGEEVRNVGRSEDLVLSFGVLDKELAKERIRLVELFVRLESGDLESRVVDVRKTLFDAADPVTSEVAERRIDPALLVRDVHQTHKSGVDFGVGHVGEIAGSSVGLGREL